MGNNSLFCLLDPMSESRPVILARTDELLAQMEFPPLTRLPATLSVDDVLVTCAGFEDRALAFLKRAVSGGSRGFHIIGIDYRPVVAENQLTVVRDLATQAGAALTVITYERQEPEKAQEILGPAVHARRIYIDISGMSRLLIVQLVAASVRDRLLERVVVVYTEAEVYPPTRTEVEANHGEEGDYLGILQFISSGVFGITIVPELSTVAMQGQPVRLVAFPSFNPSQFAAVCAEIQAAAFTIVHGSPPRSDYSWRRDAIRRLNAIDSLQEKEEFDVSTLDYRETFHLLLTIYGAHGDVEKIVISPTGSKMQAVAVGLVCGYLRDIQIVYPTPRSFPTPSKYTTGAGETYQLALAPFAEVVPPPQLEDDLVDDGDGVGS
jgi:hypothetical protein